MLQRDVVQFCVKSAFDCFTNVNEKSKLNLKQSEMLEGMLTQNVNKNLKDQRSKQEHSKGVLSQNVNKNLKFKWSKEERSKGCDLPPHFNFRVNPVVMMLRLDEEAPSS